MGPPIEAPCKEGTPGEAKSPSEICDLTAQNSAFVFIDFYIIETLYISITIVNSDHAVEAPMGN